MFTTDNGGLIKDNADVSSSDNIEEKNILATNWIKVMVTGALLR